MNELNAHEVRAVAVEAIVDPRSVRRFLAGDPKIRPTTAARITRALRRLHLVER